MNLTGEIIWARPELGKISRQIHTHKRRQCVGADHRILGNAPVIERLRESFARR